MQYTIKQNIEKRKSSNFILETMNNNKNKILFMLHLPPPIHGSSIVGEIIYKNELLRDNFNTYYIDLLMSKTVKETGKINIRKILDFSKKWLGLLKTLIIKRPDLCYYALSTTGSAFFKDFFLISLLRLFNVRIVLHLHNKGVIQHQHKWIYNKSYRLVFKNTSVILLSGYLYYDIEKYVSTNNVYHCPNGLKDSNSYTVTKCITKDSTFKILFLSNLIKSKGVFDLVNSCEILYNKGLDFKCDFIGGEGDITKVEFEEYVSKKGLSEHIKYLGKKFDEEKYREYANADVFVFPTSNDCFPLVLIEAMQFEIPIISTYEGGIPDIIDQGVNGYLVHKKDTKMIADKIDFLIKNPLTAKNMGKEGRNKYEDMFTQEIFEQKIISILNIELKKHHNN